MDPQITHEKIIGFLDEKGPSLPINIAKALQMSSLFISAFLSELTNEKRINVSSLKVGGSPLYYLSGQENKLEDYYKYLHPREAEAFLLLKEYKVLKDVDQDPVMRVALRAIKDFSVGFKLNDDIYWRFVSFPMERVDEVLGGRKLSSVSENKVEKVSKDSELNIKRESNLVVKKESDKNQFDNPVVVKEKSKKREKPRSEFVNRVVRFLNDNGLIILKEKDYKAKEYNCVIQVKSELGKINFLTQAKDKKTINEGDFKKLLSRAQSIPLPAFMVYTGEISKKAKDYLREYSSVLKAKRVV
jgi:hypothetical protein